MAEETGVETVWFAGVLMQRLWSVFSPFVSYDRPESALAAVEEKILQVSCPHRKCFIDVGLERYIWTLSFNPDSPNTPLVLLHGMGVGAALWVLNSRGLSINRPVYAIDILGFGRSSRLVFSSDPVLAEMEFVESIEEWRKKMNIEMFILLGHCFGGFLATSYAIRYPNHVRHLILVNPWGFPDRARVEDHRVPMPAWVKTLGFLIQPFNPLALLRAARSWGPTLVKRCKPDLIRNFEDIIPETIIAEYIYEWNALLPTGETAFKHMMFDFGWAIYPMSNRINEIAEQVPITNIFGSRSWVDSSIGENIKRLRPNCYVETQIISGAGHYVFAEKSDLFNRVVNRICLLVDYQLDLTHSSNMLVEPRRRSRSESAPNLRLRHSSHRLLARHRRERNSICLSEVEESETDSLAIACAVVSSDETKKAIFNISDGDE